MPTGGVRFLNADLIAVGLSPFDPDRAALRSGRLLLSLVGEAVARRESFPVETTLSGHGYARSIPEWRAAGYVVTLIFLALPDVDTAIARVAERVRQGGHDIPVPTIRRRFEAARFVPTWTAQDQITAFGLFGHLPGHLALLDPERSLAENAAAHLLSPAGRLVDDAQHVLDAFTAEAAVHYSILEAIAGGETTWSGITSRVGRSGGALSRPLAWLGAMGLVERAVPITEKRPDRSKRAVYRVRDPYLAFWHRVVAPLVHAGSVGLVDPVRLWEEAVVPKLDDHMGGVFEAVCRDFVGRQARRASGGDPGALPFRPLRVGSWWDAASRDEVDVVALGGAGELLVGEATWGPVTERHLTTLRRRAALVADDLGGAASVHVALFTGRGEADRAVRAEAEAGRVLLVTADDLVAE